MSVPLGVKRLDELLGGGVPPRSTTLVLGPAYTGKHALADRFALAGASAGEPAVVVTTDAPAGEVHDRLAAAGDDAKVAEHEKAGRLRYVDTYTATIGGDQDHPAARYVGGTANLNDFARVMNDVQREVLAEHEAHRVVFDSLTTLIVDTNARTVFRFLQVLLGRTRQAGGTTLLLMEAGVHEPSEVELVKHLTDGLVETRRDEDRTLLRVEGLGLNQTPGWVEYRWSDADGSFEVTGSFGVGRVR